MVPAIDELQSSEIIAMIMDFSDSTSKVPVGRKFRFKMTSSEFTSDRIAD